MLEQSHEKSVPKIIDYLSYPGSMTNNTFKLSIWLLYYTALLRRRHKIKQIKSFVKSIKTLYDYRKKLFHYSIKNLVH